jgi:hypothetical protein
MMTLEKRVDVGLLLKPEDPKLALVAYAIGLVVT